MHNAATCLNIICDGEVSKKKKKPIEDIWTGNFLVSQYLPQLRYIPIIYR